MRLILDYIFTLFSFNLFYFHFFAQNSHIYLFDEFDVFIWLIEFLLKHINCLILSKKLRFNSKLLNRKEFLKRKIEKLICTKCEKSLHSTTLSTFLKTHWKTTNEKLNALRHISVIVVVVSSIWWMKFCSSLRLVEWKVRGREHVIENENHLYAKRNGMKKIMKNFFLLLHILKNTYKR